MKNKIKILFTIFAGIIGFTFSGLFLTGSSQNASASAGVAKAASYSYATSNNQTNPNVYRSQPMNNQYQRGYGYYRNMSMQRRHNAQMGSTMRNYSAMRRASYGSQSTSGNQSATRKTVSIQNFSFSPSNVSVSAGDTVVWVNNDSVAHTVTSDNGMFDSGTLMPGATYRMTLSTPGIYTYHCSIHPQMRGTVTVSGASSSSMMVVRQPSSLTPYQAYNSGNASAMYSQTSGTGMPAMYSGQTYGSMPAMSGQLYGSYSNMNNASSQGYAMPCSQVANTMVYPASYANDVSSYNMNNGASQPIVYVVIAYGY